MADEIEVKIRISEDMLKGVEEKLRAIGFRPLSESTFENNLLFDFPEGSLEGSGCALRLRNYGDKYTLTYKGPKKSDLHMKVRQEIETVVGSFDSARSLLESIGLQVTFEYAKWRRKYQMNWKGSDVEVCIDETPIGVFVEIEGERESIIQIAAQLGWNSSDYITENYVDLYRQAAKDGT
jgi:adenylate cyclase class 2